MHRKYLRGKTEWQPTILGAGLQAKAGGWIKSKVRIESTKRPGKDSTGDVQRSFSRHYFFSDQEDNEHAVCKIFFLRTFGYTSDKVITATLKNCKEGAITPSSSKRGKNIPANKIPQENQEVIITHTKSFNPSVKHYGREHAPNRLYLSPELTIKFCLTISKKCTQRLSYDRYKKEVARMNIIFVMLGEEECEDCIMYEKH